MRRLVPRCSSVLAWVGLFACLLRSPGQEPAAAPSPPPQVELRHGRELLTQHQFREAEQVFRALLRAHPEAVQARLGLGDAQLGLRQYEAAETSYRAVAAAQPELWQAHKNLVVVEAALGRWEEFDRERTVLRLARERGAPGISARESDVIDSFSVGGRHWVVRAYFQPLGRAQARYNFERFSPQGRVEAYLSLEDSAAAQAALVPGDERIGAESASAPPPGSTNELALNWYTGEAHGHIRSYPAGEPSYETLRSNVVHWLESHPAVIGSR